MNEQIDKKVDVAEVLSDKDELKRRNDDDSREIDDIFAARSKLDADTKKVEVSIQEVKAGREEIVRGMGPEHASAYAEMTSENERCVCVSTLTRKHAHCVKSVRLKVAAARLGSAFCCSYSHRPVAHTADPRLVQTRVNACRYVGEIDAYEAKLTQLNAQATEMDAELQQNPMKRDAIRLYDQIAQMKAKRDQIKSEIEVRLPPHLFFAQHLELYHVFNIM